MERQPEVFDPLFRSMVRSGEGSGRLEEALDRVAFHLEKLDALRRQIRSAMMYPAFVFALAVVVMLAVVAFIVPVFVGDLRGDRRRTARRERRAALHDPDHGRRSPTCVTGYWYILLPAIVGVIVGFSGGRRPSAGARSGIGSS